MEYEAFGIPKEDLVIFLHVPYEFSQKLIDDKKKRKYMGNEQKKDIHESNTSLMREVEQVYLDFCSRFPHWIKIECVEKGVLLSREEIHEKIIAVLKRKRIL
jgi:dTMP kinase